MTLKEFQKRENIKGYIIGSALALIWGFVVVVGIIIIVKAYS